jgi:hypothetical protein
MCGSPLKNESLLGTIYLSADLLRMIPPIGRGGKPLGNGALDEVTYEKRRGFQAGQPHNRLLIADKSQKLCFSCNSQPKINGPIDVGMNFSPCRIITSPTETFRFCALGEIQCATRSFF